MAGLLFAEKDTAKSTCRVRLTLTDAANGSELPGLVRIVDSDGKAVASDKLLSRGLGLEGQLPIHQWLVVPRTVEIDLPAGKYTIHAISGIETEESKKEVTLEGAAESKVSIALTRFANPAADGLRAGNTHLHLMKQPREMADRYLREVPPADGLELLFVSYLERAEADREYVSNVYTSADLAKIARESKVLFGNGEEHRHNFTAQGEGYGHVMFLNIRELVQPVSIGPGIMLKGNDGLPLQRGIDTARRGGATAIWCHNDWGMESLPNWLTGRVDAHNIFDGGVHGSYKDSFYKFLNAGLKVPFSTGTDWFMYDFSRVYVRVDGELTTAGWLTELAAGRNFITNGPLLDLRVANRQPGDTLKLAAAEPVAITAKGTGRVDFERIELVRNGEVVASAPTKRVGRHFEAELKTSFDLSKPCWLALRTPPPFVPSDPDLNKKTPLNEFGAELFSHTSPVYVMVAGRAAFDPVVARELLEKMKKSRATIVEKGKFEDDLAKARVTDVYNDGIAALERRLAQE